MLGKTLFALITMLASALLWASLGAAQGRQQLLAVCWSYYGCKGNRQDISAASVGDVDMTGCKSAYIPLARGKLCSAPKCGGTCGGVHSSTQCYDSFALGPFQSYCPGN